MGKITIIAEVNVMNSRGMQELTVVQIEHDNGIVNYEGQINGFATQTSNTPDTIIRWLANIVHDLSYKLECRYED